MGGPRHQRGKSGAIEKVRELSLLDNKIQTNIKVVLFCQFEHTFPSGPQAPNPFVLRCPSKRPKTPVFNSSPPNSKVTHCADGIEIAWTLEVDKHLSQEDAPQLFRVSVLDFGQPTLETIVLLTVLPVVLEKCLKLKIWVSPMGTK